MRVFKNISIIIFIFLLSSKGFAQKYFNELFDYNTQELELFSGVIQLKDSGYLSTGSSFKSGIGGNYYAVRTDKKGIKLYEKHYEIPFTEIYSVSALKSINDSEFVAVGLIIDQDTNRNRINRDAILLKINQNGDTIWTKRFGLAIGTSSNPDFELANSVVITKDKGFAFVGYSNNFSGGNYQIYIVKTDSAGNFLWQNGYGGSSTDNAFSIIETADKGFLLVGYTYSYGAGDRDGYLIKTDSLGNFQWQRTYGGVGNDGMSNICMSLEGGYLLCGWTKTNSSLTYQANPWLIKIDVNGNQQWSKKYGCNAGFGEIDHLVQLQDSSYVCVGGVKDSLSFPISGLIMKVKSNGDSLWARKYKRSTTQDDYFNRFCTTNDGGFVIAGQVSAQVTPTATQDAWLIKVDCNGADSITHYFGDTCLADFTVSIRELVFENDYPTLLNNYPNPFYNTTVIPYYLPDDTDKGIITITDMMGRMIQSYNLEKGAGKVEFNTEELQNGVYYYSLMIEGKLINTKKMTLIK